MLVSSVGSSLHCRIQAIGLLYNMATTEEFHSRARIHLHCFRVMDTVFRCLFSGRQDMRGRSKHFTAINSGEIK